MILVALLCLFLAPMVAASARADDGAAPWRVVILRNWDSLYPVNVVREAALRQALLENAPRIVEIYPEEIDPLRFPQGPLPEMVAYLKSKYRDVHIDLVIAAGREPLDFAVQNRAQIWPGAPIVFVGVVEGTMDGWTRAPRTTGITMTLDVEGTLRVGLALAPQARRVYFIAGTAAFDEMFLRLAMRDFARLPPSLEARFLTGLPREELFRRVSTIEPDSLVLFLTMLRDGAGQISPPGADTILRVARASPAPVLTAHHTGFRRGSVGGSSARFDEHGRLGGQLARRILEGADPDAIPIAALPGPTCELDWQALQRWSIPDRNIPAQCRVVNRPPGLWDQNLAALLVLMLIMLIEGALIWMLVLQSRRRRAAEAQLKLRGAELAQVARLSTMGALTASIAHEINQPMGAILSNAEAAQMMLDRGELKPDKLREILVDIRNEDLHASQVISALRKLLARHESKTAPLDVNAEVAEALRHVTFEAAQRHVALLPEFDRDIPPVLGDAVQLQQVVINLAMNAVDAVREAPEREREVRVSTKACRDGMELIVADRGPGIRAEDEDRIFESMFTTKKDGMGLGLSIVRAIVESFGGRVWYERNIPHGAVFRVWLPAMGR